MVLQPAMLHAVLLDSKIKVPDRTVERFTLPASVLCAQNIEEGMISLKGIGAFENSQYLVGCDAFFL